MKGSDRGGELLEHLPSGGVEFFSGGAQEDGSVTAFEEGEAEGEFEGADLSADGAMGDEESVGGAREAEFGGGDVEDLKGVQGNGARKGGAWRSRHT